MVCEVSDLVFVCEMIVADGELKASRALKEAASGFSPVAHQLRYLQSLTAVCGEASITVLPWPKDLLDMFIAHHA